MWNIPAFEVWPGTSAMEQFSILGHIGEGAHGIVFKAKQIEVNAAAHPRLFTYETK